MARRCKGSPLRATHQRSFDGHRLREEADTALRKQRECLDGLRLIGEIVAYGGAIDTNNPAPDLWVLCDGRAISREAYVDLFRVLGTRFGAGDGSRTFNVPDLRGRMGIGVGTGTGLTARTLGTEYGAETHTHTVSGTVAGHTHSVSLTTDGHTHSDGSLAAEIMITDAGDNDDIHMDVVTATSWTSDRQLFNLGVRGTDTASGITEAADVQGATGSSTDTASGTTGSASPSVTGSTDAADHIPPALGLNYLIYAGA